MVMSAADSFQNPTHEVHELWQTDFTYFRIVGWGWYFLSTILDDYSRYIISWRLTTTMAASDVTDISGRCAGSHGAQTCPRASQAPAIV